MTTPPVVTPSVSPAKDVWRLVVSYVTTAVIGLIARLGFHADLRTTIVVGLVVGLILAAVLRWAERSFPWVGALLGLIGAPTFPASARLQAQAYTQSLEAQLAALQTQVNEALAPSKPSAAPVNLVTPEPSPTVVPSA